MIDVRQTLLGAGKMNKGRLEAFTDAILAIIMTIDPGRVYFSERRRDLPYAG